MSNKSELQCLSLLYSAIKNILKPLIEHSYAIAGMANYISVQNLWFRDTRCYLLMCRRSKNKNILKTEQTIRTLPVNVSQNKEFVMLSKLGEVFWDVFYPSEEEVQSANNIFKSILKAMIKGQVTISGVLDIMEDKTAKKKFIAQHRSKQLTNTLDITQNLSTIDHENVYQRIQNMPINMGRRTLFFKANKGREANSKSRDSRKARASLDLS